MRSDILVSGEETRNLVILTGLRERLDSGPPEKGGMTILPCATYFGLEAKRNPHPRVPRAELGKEVCGRKGGEGSPTLDRLLRGPLKFGARKIIPFVGILVHPSDGRSPGIPLF